MFIIDSDKGKKRISTLVVRKRLMARELIPDDQIEEILSIYKDEHQYIVDAAFAENVLTCKLKSTIYPYTKEVVFDYITSVTATLYVCQLAYLLFAELVKHGQVPEVCSSYKEYILLRNTARLKFLRFNFKFFDKVENLDGIEAKISFIGQTTKKGKHFLKTSFSIGSGIKGELITTVSK